MVARSWPRAAPWSPISTRSLSIAPCKTSAVISAIRGCVPSMRCILASALLLGEGLTALVVYDRRLAGGARAAGLVVASPGRD